ncbi:MAG: hypothetical protein HOE45_07190 [Gammaproteobacteria bacterium]|jgi:hypothetical protein|nr:hypothetical protein [Gammaproteobacteria bacterium]MBT4146644.1 hypothetical protein [Gammaproteobacteria bacterium]MBT5223094.1 hypothetical protein [Gammaproteobacteria bacterium]MBT5826245.1 hypothetical protein [Gammaproteobacteria bacterium]MBT5965783.1 hypothetical protein [Gammaproteobacteria bacterium]
MGFLSGIFSSKQTSQNIYRDEISSSSDEGLTGVAKYIQTQGDKPVGQGSYTKKVSGVAEYISTHNANSIELTSAEKDVINARINEAIELRKIEESLMSAENEELSGVARYVEHQEQVIRDAQEAKVALTGVAKYLSTVVENKPVLTGVARYLFNRADAQVSSVDRYVINKSLADKNKPEVVIIPPSSVTKYLESRPTILTSSVAKYIAKQAVAEKQLVA